MTQNAISPTPPIARPFVDEACDAALRAGVDLPGLLRDLNIGQTDLNRLSPAAFARFWLALSDRMGDEYFGMGRRPMRPGSFTLMGHAVRDAGTFETALRRALRFLRVVMDEPYGELDLSADTCRIRLVERDGPRSPFAYRTFFLILHGLNCWLVADRISITRIAFPCPEPRTTTDYADFFGLPVTFDAPEASLSFHRRYLARRVRRSEPELKSFLRKTPEAFLRGYRDTASIKARIVALCQTGDPASWPDGAEIARQLGLSKSTLHRRLAEDGQSLRAIRSEIRRERAEHLLRETNMPVAEIGVRVGYAEPSAFFRAFAGWYGKTPGDMRAEWAKTKGPST